MLISLSRPLPLGSGAVTQNFGENPERYKTFKVGNQILQGHDGLDYGVASGTRVLAAHAGIGSVGWDPTGYGIFVTVTGPEYKTIYAHLLLTYVFTGVAILQGMQIGLSGSTGNSTGFHLHWGLKVQGMRNRAYFDWIDPEPFRDI